MLFNSPIFILGFLPACLAGYFLVGRWLGPRAALGWIACASLVFYAWWDPRCVPLLAGSVAANYALGRVILCRHAAGRIRAARGWMAAGVAANLALLGWCKYADFLLRSVAPDAPPLGIVLPLGISFFTFQQIMFLVDSARGEGGAVGPLPYACFVTFFPHLIAGPIVRPHEIIPQFQASGIARPNHANLTAGLTIFLLGLARKLVLADSLAPFADAGFNAAAHNETLTLIEAWYAVLAYALQVYFDFSGYSDMAIGLARMLNVRFPLNFDRPYQAPDIAAFWRRWHITLGGFLRDHVYHPLGGNRCGGWRHAGNLMATLLLGGLWHGAAWHFVLWGGLHGLYLTAHTAVRRCGLAVPGGRLITLLAVIVAWVPFRAEGLDATCAMLRGMAGLNGLALPQMIVGAWPPLAAIATPVPVLRFLGEARTLSFVEASALLGLGWFIVLALPSLHTLSERMRAAAVAGSFAFTVQALFFAPKVTPFLYFQF